MKLRLHDQFVLLPEHQFMVEDRDHHDEGIEFSSKDANIWVVARVLRWLWFSLVTPVEAPWKVKF